MAASDERPAPLQPAAPRPMPAPVSADEQSPIEHACHLADSFATAPEELLGCTYDPPGSSLILRAKIIIRELAKFGAPHVATHGFADINLTYNHSRPVGISGEEKEGWTVYHGTEQRHFDLFAAELVSGYVKEIMALGDIDRLASRPPNWDADRDYNPRRESD
jgi:hypothetical protein